eukprot:scaffold24574_cov157-Cylindrotheca_fusiformis.AAC.3
MEKRYRRSSDLHQEIQDRSWEIPTNDVIQNIESSAHFQEIPMMMLTTLVLLATISLLSVATAQQPLIYDSDYGPFIDDVFALGLLLNSDDLVDLQLIVATSEDPELSAKCMVAQMELSNKTGIPVAVGSTLPDYSERGSVCAIPGNLAFAMEAECLEGFTGDAEALIANGTEYMAQMIMDSGRDDWWYLVVGGQTTLKALIENYPEAAAKIDTLIVMAGNWCADFEPYPGVMAPTDETNIGCDPGAANYVLDANNTKFNHVYYVPVVVADVIGGADYEIFTTAATSDDPEVYDAAANATLEWYKIWSNASRANEDLLVYEEAMTYDPATESTPQFDPVAVMLMLEMLSDSCDESRFSLIEMDGIHFYEPGDDGLQDFPAAPRSAFSMHTGVDDASLLPDQCPNITSFTFNVTDTPEEEYPVQIALGFVSWEAKAAVYGDMAKRMAGMKVLCESDDDDDTEAPSASPGDGGDGSDDSSASTFLDRFVGVIAMMTVLGTLAFVL